MSALDAMPMEELRSMRAAARRSLELSRMRLDPQDPRSAAELESLRTIVEEATEELIRRYSEDLSLVDSLLSAPYARDTSRHEAGES